jgi:hypothetical protein
VIGLRVIACARFPREGPSALHDLARGQRAGRPDAHGAVAALVVRGLAREAPDLDAAGSATLVPMAGHRTGTASAAAATLAEALVACHPGWVVVPALERLADAPRAMDGGPRDPGAEALTLRWPAIGGDGPVVLVDDVVHTGASLRAAWLAAPPELRARITALVAFRAED